MSVPRLLTGGPLSRCLQASLLLVACGLLGTMIALGTGTPKTQDASLAMAALLAAEPAETGRLQRPLPDLAGAREVEAAALRGDDEGLARALGRYRSRALQVLVAAQREKEVRARWRWTAATLLALTCLASLAWLLRRLQKLAELPLERLEHVARGIKTGDLGRRAPPLPEPEHDRLSLSLNAMLEALQQRLSDLQKEIEAREALIQALPMPVVVVGAEGRITRANRAAREEAGAEPEGRDVREALPLLSDSGDSAWDGAPEGTSRTVRRASQGGSMTLQRVGLPGGAGQVAVLRDIRRELQREILSHEALVLLGRELRQPLLRMADAAGSLSRPELAGPLRHALELVEGLAPEDRDAPTGGWRARFRPVDLLAVLDACVRSLQGRARSREVLLAPSLEAVPVQADPVYLRLALHQILERAIEACRPGGKVGVCCWGGEGTGVVEILLDDAGQAAAVRDWLARSPPGNPSERDGSGLAGALLKAHGVALVEESGDRIRLLVPQAAATEEPREMMLEPTSPADLPPPEGSYAALERDEAFGLWLNRAVGVQVFRNSADLPLRGLDALLLDLDHGPPVNKADLPPIPLLCLADRPGERLDRFHELGARGLVGRLETAVGLVRALRQVARGEWVLSREALEALLERTPRMGVARPFRGLEELTSREQDVFAQVIQGSSNREIADALAISEGTVKSHVNSVLRKLGIRGRVQLLLHAARHGLIPEEESGPPP